MDLIVSSSQPCGGITPKDSVVEYGLKQLSPEPMLQIDGVNG